MDCLYGLFLQNFHIIFLNIYFKGIDMDILSDFERIISIKILL